MDDGWFKVAWKTKDSPGCSSAVAMGVWMHLLCRVSRRDRTLRNGMMLLAGQAQISEVAFAADLDVSRKVMRRLLNLYVDLGMIEVTKRDRNGTAITVCNWRTYNDSEKQKGQQRNSNETATEHKRNSKEHQTEIPKKERREEGKNKGASPRFVKPTSAEVADYCRERNNGIDAEAFIAHYEAVNWKRGKGVAITDWKACVRTWEANRRDAPRGSPAANPKKTEAEIQAEIRYALSGQP